MTDASSSVCTFIKNIYDCAVTLKILLATLSIWCAENIVFYQDKNKFIMRYLFVSLFTKKSSEGVLLDKQKLKPETVEKLSRKNTNSLKLGKNYK